MARHGKVILVTGATGGIGAEIAAQAAEADTGTIVAIHGSGAGSVAASIARLRERVPGGRFLAAPADYGIPGEFARMVGNVVGQTGRLDAVIDCAILPGDRSITGPFVAVHPLAIGQPGTGAAELAMVCHAVHPHLAETGGAIVAFASDAGRFAAPRQAMIGAKQAAIIGFVRNIGLEFARDGIRVNCISPSFVEETPIFERFSNGGRAESSRRRAGLGLPSPRGIAPLALFLCGPGSARITGQVISVNGGLNA
jgi:3-oxoacyl-[acyl-carrier protein] reductase